MLLVLFAAVAGAGTALSPCVLPVLPAVLSAGATGGRRRPMGVVVGLAVTFTITIVGAAEVVRGVGLGDGALRSAAVVVLLAFGAVLLVPRFALALERPLARAGRLGPRSRGRGFVSGLGVGAALGFLYAPCAGPILAAVISVGAASGTTVAVGAAFAAGSSAVLLVLALGGRRVAAALRRAGRGPALQRGLGAVLVVTAVAVLTGADLRFQAALADRLPAAIVDPTGPLERSRAVKDRLADLQGSPRFAQAAGRPSQLPVLGTAPDFQGTQRWFNTPGGRPLALAALRGHVVLVDFWTYTCINCLRTLPALRAWDARYRAAGLVVVGVHTPEFRFERDAANVRVAIARNDIRYAVAQDNAYATWKAYGNQYWPAEYLVDAQGRVRRAHFGEGDYDGTEAAIRALLAEAGDGPLGPRAGARPEVAGAQATPETYLGAARAERWLPAAPRRGVHTYAGTGPRALPVSRFALRGTWSVDDEAARAVRGAQLDAHVLARDIHLVLGPTGRRPGRVSVLLDGRPIDARRAGADVHGGRVTVRDQRLYRLVALPGTQEHRLTLRFGAGVAGFAFTFG